MIKQINHIGIAVHDLEVACRPYEALGLSMLRVVDVPNRPLKVAFLPVGGAELELLQPTSPDSDLAEYLQEKGEGIHHICFEVDDIDAALETAKAAGMKLIDHEPRQGATGRIAFVHPDSTHGVRIEFVQQNSTGAEKTS